MIQDGIWKKPQPPEITKDSCPLEPRCHALSHCAAPEAASLSSEPTGSFLQADGCSNCKHDLDAGGLHES